MFDVHGAFQEYHPGVLRYLTRLTGDHDLAADAAQEAFVRLSRNPPPDQSRIRSWLYRVATNFAFDTIRVANRRAEIIAARPQESQEERPAIPDVELERAERRAAVRKALATLREKERAVLLMRAQGFAYREIADALDVPVNSIGAVGARALRKLAARLAPREVLF